jgi:phospholipase C
MKLAAKSLALLFTLAATLAHTQTLPHFQHIIILFQENRTPDNLFGGNPTFEPGVDLQQSALAQPWCLGACFDPITVIHRLSRFGTQAVDKPPCAMAANRRAPTRSSVAP